MAGDSDQPQKKSLFGWATGALKKLENAIDAAAEAPAPSAPATPSAPGRAAHTGALPGTPRASGPLSLPNARQTADLKKPASGPLRATDGLSLSGTLPAAPAPKPAAGHGVSAALAGPVAKSLEEQAEESKVRLKMILAYMKDPESDPSFKNKPLMYRILTEERTYQQSQIAALDAALQALPPPASAMGLSEEEAAADPTYAGLEERRKALQDKLHVCQTRQTQLFSLMKKLTGVKGKTGGTGFLATANELPPAP